jgi:hypothetical protein
MKIRNFDWSRSMQLKRDRANGLNEFSNTTIKRMSQTRWNPNFKIFNPKHRKQRKPYAR